MSATPECFYVLYNTCYGGFSLSKDATDEYARRTAECNTADKYKYRERYDPILIEMFLDEEWNTNGTRINGPHAKLDIAMFYTKYQNCIDIEEYDGLETPVVNMGRYYKKQLKQILYDDAIDDHHKVELIKSVITEHDTYT